MRPIEIGLVLPMGDSFIDGTTATLAALDALVPMIEMLDAD